MKVVKGNFSGMDKTAKPIRQNQENKDGELTASDDGAYSIMLLDLIKPHMSAIPYLDEIREMLELAIVGWNMAVSKTLGFPDVQQLLDDTIRATKINKKGTAVIQKIMVTKALKYPEQVRFIESYKINEGENNVTNISVISRSIDDLEANQQVSDEGFNELQYEQGFVNRNALVVKPKPLFWEWLKKQDSNFVKPHLLPEHTVYLVCERETTKEAEKWLMQNFDKIFINELEAWIADENYWPKRRNYKMFRDFFELSYHAAVIDLEDSPVVKG